MQKIHPTIWLFFFFLLIPIFSPGTGNAAEAITSKPPLAPNEYLLGLGDIIEVQVWKEPDLTKTLTVRLDGRISLPLAGDVLAAGKSPEQLASDLETKLKSFITDPSVTVILNQSTSRKYYIIGQIIKPGEFNIDAPLSILQALARSGGFQEWAKKDKITIIRRQNGRDSFLPFDYDSLVEGHNLSQNIEIAPGDTIVVP
jgi:polysaccharide export outer membrane protein